MLALLLDQQARQETLALQDRQALLQLLRVQQALLAPQGRKALKVLLDLLVRRVCRVCKATLAQQAQQERKAHKA
jgi:hypothetical protein